MNRPLPDRGIVATLPVRSLLDGKRRLAHQLGASERSRLIMSMCATVVAALHDSGVIATIGMVSGDTATLDFGRSLGLTPIPEREHDLNSALRTASEWAAERGDQHLIVLPDLPLLRPDNVRELVESTGPPPSIVLCPDRTRTGTNMLLLQPCACIPPLFGAGSMQRHLAAARAASVAVRIYDSPGTSWDVDTPADLAAVELELYQDEQCRPA
jgi:2-phospho-L-lactate/phosphoenolpyruvate guanylyltransferase